MNGSDGFSLVEVLVAGLLLLLMLLGVASMSLTAFHQLDRGGDQTVATTLAQQRIEWLRNQGYASNDLNAGTTTETLSGDYVGYGRTTQILVDTPRAGVKQVSVTTMTPDGLTVSVVSLVAE